MWRRLEFSQATGLSVENATLAVARRGRRFQAAAQRKDGPRKGYFARAPLSQGAYTGQHSYNLCPNRRVKLFKRAIHLDDH